MTDGSTDSRTDGRGGPPAEGFAGAPTGKPGEPLRFVPQRPSRGPVSAALLSHTPPRRGALPRGIGARWASDALVVPGPAGHDGFQLRDFYLDVHLAADGRFRGSHTTYLIDGKRADDPSDVAGFRYRRSHVLLGYAYGRLDQARGTGVITVEGYGHSRLTVEADGPGRLVVGLRDSVITYCPVMYTRAVLLRRTD